MKKATVFALTCILAALVASPALAFQDVTPIDAYAMATTDPGTYILDVRTISEWQWVGHPGKNKLGEGAALEGKVVNISYQIEKKGAMVLNPSFMNEINEIFGSGTDITLITMCRSGSRSVAAAQVLEAAGYNVKNMVTGFEGGSDSKGYRTKNGWAIDGLPYNFNGAAGYAD